MKILDQEKVDIKRKIKEAIHIGRQLLTLNGDGSFELPAIFTHLLSGDYKFTRKPGAFIAHEDFAIQSKATRKKSESLRLEFILSLCVSLFFSFLFYFNIFYKFALRVTRTRLQRLSVSRAWRLDREMRRRLILY